MTPSADSEYKPWHRRWFFLGRVVETCFIGTSLGLTAYVSTSQSATGWPPESGAHGTLDFLGAATGLGTTSALISFALLCFKFNKHDALSKNSHRFCGFKMAFVYLGVLSAALSIGAVAFTIKNMGDSGLRCTGDSMKTYQFCSMLMAIVVLTIIGAFVTLVSAGFECARIRQWGRVVENCQVTYR